MLTFTLRQSLPCLAFNDIGESWNQRYLLLGDLLQLIVLQMLPQDVFFQMMQPPLSLVASSRSSLEMFTGFIG